MSIINEKNRLGISMSAVSAIDLSMSEKELEALMKEILNEGIYGISFSPYEEGQSPADKSQLSREQIRARMAIIAPYVKTIRTFSCSYGNELIPEIAHEMGIKTMVGAWIEGDEEKNQEEIESLIRVAKAGHADMLAVGNEVLLRGEQTSETIIGYINQVKEAVPEVPVGYVDAYYLFCDNPDVTEACDIIFTNCYPYWEGCPQNQAVDYMKHMYNRVKAVAGDKPIIISETGWPNEGTVEGGAEPSYRNAMAYFINSYQWAMSEGIDLVYFSSFDEAWKVHHEGDSGAYWGLWDRKGNYKYGQ